MTLVEYVPKYNASNTGGTEEVLTRLFYGMKKDSYNHFWLRQFNPGSKTNTYPGDCHMYGCLLPAWKLPVDDICIEIEGTLRYLKLYYID